MAEAVFRHLADAEGLSWYYEADSAAVSREELGNPMYPPAVRTLVRHGIPAGNHRARLMTRADCDAFDLLLGMDGGNLRAMQRIAGGDPQGKCALLLSLTDSPGEIPDPWYTGDFEAAYRAILTGCRALLAGTRPDRRP